MRRRDLLLMAGLSPMLRAQREAYTMFPPVRGTREMVAAANNFQVEAGWRVLMAGGNAVDAGVATVLAAAVTEQSRFGLGGEMPLLLQMAGQQPVAVAGVGIAPTGATPARYRQRQAEIWEDAAKMFPIPTEGIRAAITPGVLDGLLLALQRFGTMQFAQVVAPAIELADGFPLGEEYARFLAGYEPLLTLWPTSRAFFLPNGRVPQRGELFRSPTLAVTLRELARVEAKQRGKRDRKIEAVRDHFYRGPLAQRIAAFSASNGGLITADDLARTRAELDETRSTTYRGVTVHKCGFWTQGPMMVEALNLLEGYNVKGMGWNSPRYLHTLVEALKLAFADRDQHYGDPKTSRVPERLLLSKEYAEERRRLIDAQRASREHRPGTFSTVLPKPPVSQPSGPTSTAHDTTCVNVVDRWGNVFSATPSGAWLPSVIAGDTGIPLSTRLQTFVLDEGHPNQLQPGKRPRVTLSPTIVTRDGRPWMALSTPGGDNQDQALLQVLLNVLEFGMSPQEAVEAPRFQSEHLFASFDGHEFQPGVLKLESRIPRETAEALTALGHEVKAQGPWSNGAAPTAILMENGVLHGGADPRRNRYVLGR